MKKLALLIALVLLVGTGAFWWSPAMLATSMLSSQQIIAQQQAAESSSCVPAVSDTPTHVTAANLTQEQVQVAHTIWQVAHQLGLGDRAAIVGIATASQESTLGADKSTARPNSDVDVAIFQQRALPGWYANGPTVEANVKILSDLPTAARTFFLGRTVDKAYPGGAGPVGYHIPGLVNIKGWEQMPVTVAAQKVQRSAYPTLYAKHEPMATTLVQRFAAEGKPAGEVQNPGLCDPVGAVDVATCPDSGLAAERGLTPDAVRALRCAKAKFPGILSIGGVRQDSLPYHPSGRAIDLMLPGTCTPLGTQIAEWARANAASMGVVDVIWCQKIWTVARNAEGWRLMADRGSPTQNHMDHVHITVAGNSAGTQAARQPTGAGRTVYPYAAKVGYTGRFGQCGRMWSACHTGLDFAAASGTPILAVRDGTVTSTGWNKAYGWLTKIDHGGGVETWYAHQSSQSVKVGQRVTAGQTIGKTGATGNTTGAHLHLEVRQGGSPIDPARWLTSNGVAL